MKRKKKIMTHLEIAKKIIKENFYNANCGIFNTRNMAKDNMSLLYRKNNVSIWICYYWAYFEVFGLSQNEFKELKKFYEELKKT